MSDNPLFTRLCEQYGAQYPIVAFSHTRDVVVAASNAGGIGMYGITTVPVKQMRTDIRWIRERVGDKPFGVDLTLPASASRGSIEEVEAQIPQSYWDFIDRVMKENNIPEPKTPGPWNTWQIDALRDQREVLELFMEEHVPIFASGMGSPAFILDRMHAAGVKVWGLVGTSRQAKRELEAGVDVIIAQGQDAGGHTGRIGTFSLVPEVAAFAEPYGTPVLAAGGITTGTHLVAALALGAAGVWAGTIWQATHESAVDMWQKELLVKSRQEDAWVSTAGDGKRARAIRTKFTDVWEAPDAPRPLPLPMQGVLVSRLRQSVEDWDLRDWRGIGSGQGVGFIHEIKSTRQVILDWVEEAMDRLERLGVDMQAQNGNTP